MYGHTARVWKVRAFGNEKLVSASEDTTVRLWCTKTSTQLRLMQGMCPLASKNVRGLAVLGNLIVSGGEDSSVRIFEPQIIKTNQLQQIRIPLPGYETVKTDIIKSGKLSEK